MATIDEIMRSLPDRFRPEMAGNMQATIQFDLKGEDGGQWYVQIGHRACTINAGQITNPDAAVSMDATDFIGINTGEIDAASIFWSGQIAVEGNLEVVIALAPIMGWQ